MKSEKTTQLRHITAKINVLGYIISKTKSKSAVKRKLSLMSKMLQKAGEITCELKKV